MLSAREFYTRIAHTFLFSSTSLLAVLAALLELLGVAVMIVGTFLYAGYATAFMSLRSIYLKLRSL